MGWRCRLWSNRFLLALTGWGMVGSGVLENPTWISMYARSQNRILQELKQGEHVRAERYRVHRDKVGSCNGSMIEYSSINAKHSILNKMHSSGWQT